MAASHDIEGFWDFSVRTYRTDGVSDACLSLISPSNTTSTVKKPESADLVKRRRSNASDREVTVSLTSKGRALFRKCYPQILGEAHAHMAERLTLEERAKLAGILRKLVA